MRGATHEPRVVSSRLATCTPALAAAAVRETLKRTDLGDETADALGRVADALDGLASSSQAAEAAGGGGGGGGGAGESSAANGAAAAANTAKKAGKKAEAKKAAGGATAKKGKGG